MVQAAQSYILALDQGTTSSRAMLFDHDGRVVAVRQREFPQMFPQPGWVEHDPEAIWETQRGVAQEVLAARNVSAAEIAAIGITNQRETTVIWDRATGAPIAPAIVWQDRRTAASCDALKAAGWSDRIRAKTGLVIDAYFSGTKIRWLLDHIPGAREKAVRGDLAFGTIDTFLIWRLTGGTRHVTDVTNAARTMLFNIHTGAWDDELLAALDIPRALLPEVLPSSGQFGETAAALFGQPVPITGVAGDQQAATFGQACYSPGMVKNTYGTGCFMLMNTGPNAKESHNGLLTTVAWGLRRTEDSGLTYALEGAIFVAGAAVQWLRDGLKIIENAAETAALAASVPDTGGVYLVPAFAGLGAPYWDPYARGAIVGLTRGSGRAAIVRATLEAVAYQTRDVLDLMRSESGIAVRQLRVDGGMVCNDFLMQFQADILGVPVQRPTVTETTALGAAYLAGLAVGYWHDQEEIAANWAVDRTYEPQMDDAKREDLYAGWQQAVRKARA
ncbi:MAG: glycerol kinase GlpK [Thermomicrobia bacterium]|nr:glycerol kinase GlpK [Thermomicrobia bacterium]